MTKKTTRWDKVTEWFYRWDGDKASLDELVKMIDGLLASQRQEIRKRVKKLRIDKERFYKLVTRAFCGTDDPEYNAGQFKLFYESAIQEALKAVEEL